MLFALITTCQLISVTPFLGFNNKKIPKPRLLQSWSSLVIKVPKARLLFN
nr:MAG TPA: hypothetical protein [Caudoviricetes sp.]